MRPTLLVVVALSVLVQSNARAEDAAPRFARTALPALPDALGFGSPFAGAADGVLLVAGGANFPDAMPWDGGRKVWHDRIYALEQPAGRRGQSPFVRSTRRAVPANGDCLLFPDSAWRECATRLPRPLGYGVSLTTPHGLLCLGGGDAEQNYADAILVRWENAEPALSPLPPLPQPCAFACGALVEQTVYIAGGLARPDDNTALRTFWALDLSGPRAAWQWRELEPWPGPGRMLAVAGAQDRSFFLFSGAELTLDTAVGKPRRHYLTDAYRYTPGKGWRALAPLPRATVAAPTPAAPLGQSHLAIFSGDDGADWDFAAKPTHRGFPAEALLYNTITDTWAPGGRLEVARVTTPLVPWADGFVVPSGEVRAGVRSAEVDVLRPVVLPRCEQRPRRPSLGRLAGKLMLRRQAAQSGPCRIFVGACP